MGNWLPFEWIVSGSRATRSVEGQFGQIATTGGPEIWKSHVLLWLAYRHSSFNSCSVDVCTHTRADINCYEYEGGVPGGGGTPRSFPDDATPFAHRAHTLRL